MTPLTVEATSAAGHLIQKIGSGPLLVEPARAREFLGLLSALAGSEDFEAVHLDASAGDPDAFWPAAGDHMGRYRPYNVTNGILQIPIMGALVNKFGYQMGSWATGYTYIDKAYSRGMDDPDVRGIALVVDSPGGEAAGNFELVDRMYARRGEKPVRAFVADTALSGGFSLATVADEVQVTPSGLTGSVGVVTMHVDYSAALENAGVKVTFIKAGEHKVDGNAYEPLSPGAQKRVQARVDKFYGVFVSTIARNRKMSEDAVRATEALVYDADESLTVGFADQIGNFEDEIAAFAVEARQSGERRMTVKNEDKTYTEAEMGQLTAAAADDAAVAAQGAERARFAAVLASGAYAGREALAHELLGTTDLSAEKIESALKVAAPRVPESKGDDPANAFTRVMETEGGAGVKSEDGGSGDGDKPPTAEEIAAQIKADYLAAGGSLQVRA